MSRGAGGVTAPAPASPPPAAHVRGLQPRVTKNPDCHPPALLRGQPGEVSPKKQGAFVRILASTPRGGELLEQGPAVGWVLEQSFFVSPLRPPPRGRPSPLYPRFYTLVLLLSALPSSPSFFPPPPTPSQVVHGNPQLLHGLRRDPVHGGRLLVPHEAQEGEPGAVPAPCLQRDRGYGRRALFGHLVFTFGDPGSSLGCAKNAAGSWPRRRGCRWPPPSDPHPFASAAPSVYTVSPEGKTPPEGRRKVEVIDLTLDSSSDEEEPPAKKQRPASGGALPAAPGPKG